MSDTTTLTVTASPEVITHGGSDRGYKLCRCSKCGRTEQCTPARDYYTRHGDPTGPLFCEECIADGRPMVAAVLGPQGLDVVGPTDPPPSVRTTVLCHCVRVVPDGVQADPDCDACGGTGEVVIREGP